MPDDPRIDAPTVMPSDARPETPGVAERPAPVRSTALTVLAVLALILTLQYAQPVCIPIVLSILISYALDPIVTFLQRLRVPRAASAAIMLLALTGGAGALMYSLQNEALEIVEQLPEGARRLRQTLRKNRQQPGAGTLEKVQKAADELQKTADEATATGSTSQRNVTRVQVEPAPFNVSDYVWWGSMGALAVAGQLLLILFLVFFLLASGDLHKRKLVKVVGPSLTKKKITVQILDEINAQIARFLLVQVLTSALVAVVTWLVLRWLGMEQAAVWGLLAGVFNSIPYLGPVAVTGGLTVVAYLQFGQIEMALIVAACALAITTLEGWLLTPALLGRAARMNQVAVFMGLMFWSWIWGVWGALLAVPILMVVKAICDRIEDLQPIGEMLGD